MSGNETSGNEELERILGYSFEDSALLREALRHPSVGEREQNFSVFERLEFLGDRVLGLVVAELLLEHFPGESEGDLARRHVSLVRREALCSVAQDIGLMRFLLFSGTGGQPNERDVPALLSDSLEAVIAALYLSGGLAPASAFIARYWRPMMLADKTPPNDSKTLLQEWAQGLGLPLPAYTIIEEKGPPHAPSFLAEVRVTGHPPGRGEGSSKRAAEQAAAGALLEMVKGQ